MILAMSGMCNLMCYLLITYLSSLYACKLELDLYMVYEY
jgi:hypothetical protein